MKEQKKTYLYNHTSPETAYTVADYPWGFRLRTTIRYWIETKCAKNGGQRFASQTINPKTGMWCAPKYSTYSPLLIMFLDEKNHVHYECLRMHDSDQNIEEFRQLHTSNLSDYQKEALKQIMAYAKVMKNVTFKFCQTPVSLFDDSPESMEKKSLLIKEAEEIEKNNARVVKHINFSIQREMDKLEL